MPKSQVFPSLPSFFPFQVEANDKVGTGWHIAAETMREEGAMAFFKGLTPKLLAVSPKLIFSFTVAQYFIDKADNLFGKH